MRNVGRRPNDAIDPTRTYCEVQFDVHSAGSRKSKNSENLAKVESSIFSLLQGSVGPIARSVVVFV